MGVGSGESVRLPPLWLGFGSRTWRLMWVEFVAGSRPCPESFFSGPLVFPPPLKNLISIRPGNSGQEEPPRGISTAAKVPLLLSLLLWLSYSSNHHTHLSHGTNML